MAIAAPISEWIALTATFVVAAIAPVFAKSRGFGSPGLSDYRCSQSS